MSKAKQVKFLLLFCKIIPRFNIVHKDFKSKLDKYNYIGIESKACGI